MKIKIALLGLALSACATAPTSSRIPSSPLRHLYHCQGDVSSSVTSESDWYNVIIDKSGYDQRAGTPVMVTVSHRLDSPTRRADWQVLYNESIGMLTGNQEDGFDVKFEDGSLSFEVGNSGIAGGSTTYRGKMIVGTNTEVPISCTQAKVP